MPLEVPPLNDDQSLRYYDVDELAQIDLQQRGTGEEHDHIRDEMGPDGSGSTRRYSCAWEHRYAAALVMVGATKAYTDSDGKLRISRLLPDSHPGRLAHNWVATKVRIDPFQHTGETDAADFGQPMPVFTRADLEVTYELVPYELFDDAELEADTEFHRYVTEPGLPRAEVTSSTNVIAFAGGSQNFTSTDGTTGTGPAGVPVPYGIGFPETITTKKFLWERLPRECWGKGTVLQTRVKGNGTPDNRGYIGSLNRTEFFGHPPLTLKLEAVEERLLPDATGIGYSWTLVFVFSEKCVPYGHLGLYFASTSSPAYPNGYYQVLATGDSQTQDVETLVTLGDGAALFHIREFADLLIVGEL